MARIICMIILKLSVIHLNHMNIQKYFRRLNNASNRFSHNAISFVWKEVHISRYLQHVKEKKKSIQNINIVNLGSKMHFENYMTTGQLSEVVNLEVVNLRKPQIAITKRTNIQHHRIWLT